MCEEQRGQCAQYAGGIMNEVGSRKEKLGEITRASIMQHLVHEPESTLLEA